LRNWRQGDQSAFDQVAESIHRELRRLAAYYLRRERAGHTLQPTALVNEAFVRLIGQGDRQDWESRSHFIAIAAQHMRQILVDYARRHRAAKRGDGATLISLDDASVAASASRPIDLLALDEALEKLSAVDSRKARAMELKFFGGLEMGEIALVLGISIKTPSRSRCVRPTLRCRPRWRMSSSECCPKIPISVTGVA
jgi:RNA polymerase sigma factor (TIGR02999 family)